MNLLWKNSSWTTRIQERFVALTNLLCGEFLRNNRNYYCIIYKNNVNRLYIEKIPNIRIESILLKIRGKKRMSKLIKASSKTKEWIKELKELIEKKKLPLDYNEFKYWASFKSKDTNRNIAQLNPTTNQIRVALTLNTNVDKYLQISPSTKGYGKSYPSFFTIDLKSKIKKAAELIDLSYENDLTL